MITRPSRTAGFTVLELMVAAVILVIFSGSAIVMMTMRTRLAVVTRNNTEARAIVNYHINRLLTEDWTTSTSNAILSSTAATSPDEVLYTNTGDALYPNKVRLWQYTKNGVATEILGTLKCWTQSDPDGDQTRRVNVRLTYSFQGRESVLESSTIRGRDY